VEQFYYILETFLILWLYQQSIKYFAIYEEKSNCEIAKWHFLTHAWPNYFFWSVLKVPSSYFIQNMSQILYKCINMWINWMISKSNHNIWKIIFVLGSYEYLERLEGKIGKCLFFYVKIFWNNSVKEDTNVRVCELQN
jgi:hypothetical protein